MSPVWRRRLAAAIFFGALAAWPLTALTVFREEPQGILGLSYLAIIIEAANTWQTTDVRKQQEEGGGES